jgi:hypothetical protein
VWTAARSVLSLDKGRDQVLASVHTGIRPPPGLHTPGNSADGTSGLAAVFAAAQSAAHTALNCSSPTTVTSDTFTEQDTRATTTAARHRDPPSLLTGLPAIHSST